jgi:hypothetical protein
MGEPARKLEPGHDAVAARWAALQALPLAEEPQTDEERALFDEAQRFVESGQRGIPAAEVTAALERRARGE